MAPNLSASPTAFCTVCKRFRPSEFFKRRPNGAGFYNTCSTCKNYRRERTVLGKLDVNVPRQTRQSHNPLPRKRKRRRIELLPIPDVPPPPPIAEPSRVEPPVAELTAVEPPAELLRPSSVPLPPVTIPEQPEPHEQSHTDGRGRGGDGDGSPRWPEESSMRCCKDGDMTLPLFQQPPDLLTNLLRGDDPRATDFRRNIRGYNSALVFTSLKYTEDDRTDTMGPGITCFTIHGSLYYLQGPLQPGSQTVLAFAQLFFYDADYATNIRHRQGLD
ncbi:hypothetical protein F5884DRAFT_852225 [Xylogone sp. PMI_703]|nr:hypothetical protein F5884DRAFT_852225 [Xylogone sp. PMI_703]